MISIGTEGETTKYKRLRERRQRKKVENKWARHTPVFIYVLRTGLDIDMIAADNSPTWWGLPH